MKPCEICGNQAQELGQDWAFVGRDCLRCGKYGINTVSDGLRADVPWFSNAESEKMVRLSGYVREQNAVANIPPLTRELIDEVIARPRPNLRTRARILLRGVGASEEAKEPLINLRTVMLQPSYAGSSYSLGSKDLGILLRVLEHEKFITFTSSHQAFAITVEGLLELEGMASTGGEFTQGFVAMWFDEELSPAWTVGFDPGIRNAGYRPFRIDKKDYIGGISDEIITEIRRSRFVVVDYTHQVNGIYFEAGFALGLGRTVIPTCRADEIPKLHFDIRHLNTLSWNEPSDLSTSLTKRIVSVIGLGPDLPVEHAERPV
jgi:hypothetical protein